MMKKSILLISITLLAAGCSSAPVRTYFHMAVPAARAGALPEIGKTLFVEPVDVEPFYNDYRMVYRLSPYELRFYPRCFWVKKPALMFREAAADFLTGSQAFAGVSAGPPAAEAELELKMRIRILEEVDGPHNWEASLAMDIEFRNAASGTILVTHNFERKTAMKEKKVQAFPESLSRIFFEELRRAVVMLSEKLGSQTLD